MPEASRQVIGSVLIPIIALSADVMPLDIKKCLEAGFFRYVAKPIKVNELMATLDLAFKFANGGWTPPGRHQSRG